MRAEHVGGVSVGFCESATDGTFLIIQRRVTFPDVEVE
jgi:hypothetical protein